MDNPSTGLSFEPHFIDSLPIAKLVTCTSLKNSNVAIAPAWRKPRAQRTPEEKWQIVLEGLKGGNIAETCRKFEIAPNLYRRWKEEVEAGAEAALGGRSAASRPDAEQEKRIKQLERALGQSYLQIEILKITS
jgi:transposase-like protein